MIDLLKHLQHQSFHIDNDPNIIKANLSLLHFKAFTTQLSIIKFYILVRGTENDMSTEMEK